MNSFFFSPCISQQKVEVKIIQVENVHDQIALTH